MAEWLRREIRNLMGSARVGSNPAAVVGFFSFVVWDKMEIVLVA